MHNRNAMLAGRRFSRLGGFLIAGVLITAAGGCLSLGGKTTYVQSSPEAEARIAGLEARVGALEQAANTREVSSPQLQSGGQVLDK